MLDMREYANEVLGTLYRGLPMSRHNKFKTHCKRGHLLAGDNIYPIANNGRNCRLCAAIRTVAWRKKQKDLR